MRARTHTRTHRERERERERRGNGTEKKLLFFKEKGLQGRFKGTDTGRMTDRNRELVPNNWSLVRER